jgi:DNA segregation ATPase FtsK/SpoIIIE, S-DNA-T family
LAPDWAPYRAINGQQIRHYLETEHGVKVATTGHKYPVDPTAIRNAITRRDTTRDPASDHPGPGGWS